MTRRTATTTVHDFSFETITSRKVLVHALTKRAHDWLTHNDDFGVLLTDGSRQIAMREAQPLIVLLHQAGFELLNA